MTVRAVVAADAARVSDIFLRSRRAAMPWLAQPHSDDETRRWHTNILVPRGTVVVAEREGDVLGFAEPTDGWLRAMYVAPSAQGAGVGSALFAHSMAAQPKGFDLWVFQRNTRALDFYARYDCLEVRRTDGADNEEHESPMCCCAGRPPPEVCASVRCAQRCQSQPSVLVAHEWCVYMIRYTIGHADRTEPR